MGNEKSSNITWSSALVLEIICLGSLAWRAFCPPTADDFFYMMKYTPDDSWPVVNISSWSDIWDSIVMHYNMKNGRFVNFLAYGVMFMPQWLISLFCAAIVAALPVLTLILAGGRKALGNASALALCALALWLLCPWYDMMQSADYLMNYVLTADGILLLMLLWRRDQTWRPRNLLWFYPLVVIISSLHEVSAIIFLTWAGLELLVSRRGPFPWKKALAIVLGIAILVFIMMSPATCNRFQQERNMAFKFPVFLVVASFGVWLFFALLLTAGVTRKFNRAFRKQMLPVVAAVVMGLLIPCVVWSPYRILFLPVTLSVAGMMMMYLNVVKQGGRRQMVVAAVATVALVAFYVNLAYWQNIVREDYESVKAEVLKKNINIVFLDLHDPTEMPIFALGIPQTSRYNDFIQAFFEYGYLQHAVLPSLPLPKAWEAKTMDEWPALPGLPDFHEPRQGLLLSKRNIKDLIINVEYSDSLRADCAIYRINKLVASATHKPDNQDVLYSTHYAGTHNGDSIYAYYQLGTSYWLGGRKPANCKIVAGEEQPNEKNTLAGAETLSNQRKL